MFRTLRFGRLRWTLRSDADAGSLLPILQDPDQFLRDRALQIKSSRVVTIARVRGMPGLPDLILRRLNYGKFLHRLRDCFRATRAHRAQCHSLLLHDAGINTPRALAAGELRVLRWPQVAYLVTEEVPGAVTLASLFHGQDSISGQVVGKIAAMIARLHDHGLSHSDLKWTNILFDKTMDPWLIDLDGVRQFEPVSDYQARLDLLSLARCFPDWRNVLKIYCEERKRSGDFENWRTELTKMLPPG
jgi:tRNA A-37 threonylcarbamoyl transferase component Bud32